MNLLAGDVGGTSARLRLENAESREVVAERIYESRSYSSLDDVVAEFIRATGGADRACLAVAGPVEDGVGWLTNLGWEARSTAIAERCGIAEVEIVNDFRALAAAVPLMGEKDLVPLNRGRREPDNPIAVVGAGTGLGEAILLPAPDGDWRIVPTEGGHSDFGPNDGVQRELLAWLARRHDHVSWERILSGAGLSAVDSFFRERLAGPVDPDRRDPDPADVAYRAGEGEAVARRAVALFVDVYGAEAGNLALKTLARGGVFIGGGMAAKNPEWLTDGRFVAAFKRKGRFTSLMDTIPVDLIVAEDAGLRGAMEICRLAAQGIVE